MAPSRRAEGEGRKGGAKERLRRGKGHMGRLACAYHGRNARRRKGHGGKGHMAGWHARAGRRGGAGAGAEAAQAAASRPGRGAAAWKRPAADYKE